MKKYLRNKWVISIALAAIALVLGIAVSFGKGDAGIEDLLANLSAEVIGAIAIFVLLEEFIGGKEREDRLKTQLKAMISCADNEIALRGAAELQAQGWLAEGVLRGEDMRFADLRGVVLRAYRGTDGKVKPPDLQGVDLSRATLVRARFLDGTNLSGANLQSVDARRTEMPGVNLAGADLQGVYMSRVYDVLEGHKVAYDVRLEEANLEGAILRGIDLTSAQMPEAILKDADLRCGWLEKVNLRGAKLQRANMNEVESLDDIIVAHLRAGTKVILLHAQLQDADLTDATMKNVYAERAHLEGAILENADLQGAILLHAKLNGANLTGANLKHAHLMHADLQDANLSGAILEGAHLEQADLSRAILEGVRCNRDTVLPNESKWSENIKWSDFTAPQKDND